MSDEKARKSTVDLTAPVCGEAEFAELVRDMVAVEAPRLFAVVRELGERVDGWIAAWGLAFEEGVELFTLNGNARMSPSSTECALHLFGLGDDVSARLVWVEPHQAD